VSTTCLCPGEGGEKNHLNLFIFLHSTAFSTHRMSFQWNSVHGNTSRNLKAYHNDAGGRKEGKRRGEIKIPPKSNTVPNLFFARKNIYFTSIFQGSSVFRRGQTLSTFLALFTCNTAPGFAAPKTTKPTAERSSDYYPKKLLIKKKIKENNHPLGQKPTEYTFFLVCL